MLQIWSLSQLYNHMIYRTIELTRNFSYTLESRYTDQCQVVYKVDYVVVGILLRTLTLV